ncbi:MAG: DUF4236 domain-containing protein [Candidatus Binataceae bacterium]
MGFRLYRRVHFPGGSINFSGRGASLSLGGRGAHVTFGRRGVTRTIGIPGTGIFWTHRDGRRSGIHSGLGPDGRPVRKHHVAGLILLAAILWALFGR